MKKLIIAIALVCVGFGAQAQVKMEEKKLEVATLPQKGTVITPKKKPGKDPRISDQAANAMEGIVSIPKIPVTSMKGIADNDLRSPNGKFLLYPTRDAAPTLILVEILDPTTGRVNELWRGKVPARSERNVVINRYEIDGKFSVLYLTGFGGTEEKPTNIYVRGQIEGTPDNLPKGSTLELGDNGNLVIRTSDGNIVWQTNTGKK